MLTVILGPMKSGKSLELISELAPLEYANLRYKVYQSSRHVRDAELSSRVGATLPTEKVPSLHVALDGPLDVVGIDEVHMFSASDVAVVRELLGRGIQVIAGGIDLDHRGELFPTVKALFELGPDKVLHRKAVCDVCHEFSAVYTQVLDRGTPFTADLGGAALPDTGSYTYEPRCRRCFVRPQEIVDGEYLELALGSARFVFWVCPTDNDHHVRWETTDAGMTPHCIHEGCGERGEAR